jgi:hypothetical protein
MGACKMKKLMFIKMLLLSAIIFLEMSCKDNTPFTPENSRWSALGNENSWNIMYWPNTFTVYGNNLIAGTIDSTRAVNAKCIYKWNGTSWVPILPRLSSWMVYPSVNILKDYNGALIAAGTFNPVYGYISSFIAINDGFWNPIGEGMDNFVYALTIYNGDLIVGGGFTTAGGNNVNYIARWNGTWSPIGCGMNGPVGALTVYNGDLIAGGSFTSAGGNNVNHIARWNGTDWAPLGNGINGCNKLIVYNNELIAYSGNYSSKWNGTTWTNFSNSFNDSMSVLTSMVVYNGELVVGGDFSNINGISANSIAKWNGTKWSPLETGLQASNGSPGSVESLVIYNNELIVGGNFVTAGGVKAICVAKWH